MVSPKASDYYSPQIKKPSRLSFSPSAATLGTAQLGLEYGLANRSGMPNMNVARDILTAAHNGGITVFDTARSYGCSEERIGDWLTMTGHRDIKVITKLPAIHDDDNSDILKLTKKFLNRSKAALQNHKIDLLLAHRGRDLLNDNVLKSLEQAKADGYIDNIGASVYDPKEAKQLLRTTPISAIQLPISLVDRRMINEGVLECAQSAGVAVFARSLFLQGALLMRPVELPKHLEPLIEPITALQQIAADSGLPMEALALNAVRDLQGVTSIVIGVENTRQLAAHMTNINLPPLTQNALEQISLVTRNIPSELIDPSKW